MKHLNDEHAFVGLLAAIVVIGLVVVGFFIVAEPAGTPDPIHQDPLNNVAEEQSLDDQPAVEKPTEHQKEESDSKTTEAAAKR